MMVLGLFLVCVGIGGLVVGGPSPDYWGPGAGMIGIGLSAGWVGWCFWFPGTEKPRKPHEKSRRHS